MAVILFTCSPSILIGNGTKFEYFSMTLCIFHFLANSSASSRKKIFTAVPRLVPAGAGAISKTPVPSLLQTCAGSSATAERLVTSTWVAAMKTE